MTENRSVQNAPHRGTEGQIAGRKLLPGQAQRGESNQAPRRRGRPAGSRNKAKGIMPTELANTILLEMKEMLPAEHYEYMKGVIREGKAISTKTELDTLILLLSRNLYPALVMETLSPQEDAEDDVDSFFDDDDDDSPKPPKKSSNGLKMPVFRKDVTERLKVVQGLLSLRNQVEKRDADNRDEDKPIIKLVAGRGIDASRLRILVGIESTALVGDADGNGQPADSPRTVSNPVPERQVILPVGEQGETDRVLDGDSG